MENENIDPVVKHHISPHHTKGRPLDTNRSALQVKEVNTETKPTISAKTKPPIGLVKHAKGDEKSRAPLVPTTKASRYREQQIIGLMRRRNSSTNDLHRLEESCMSDDASVGSLRSVGSSDYKKVSRKRPVSCARNPKNNIPTTVRNGAQGLKRAYSASSISKENNSDKSVNKVNKEKKGVKTTSWVVQQRKVKEEREKRRIKPGGTEDILLHELEKSYHRLDHEFGRPPESVSTNEIKERPQKFQKNSKNEKSPRGGKNNNTNVTSAINTPLTHTPVKKRCTDVKSPPRSAPRSASRSGYKTPTSKRSVKMSPMSYSQAVKMGNTPQFIRRLFDNKTKDIYTEVNALDPKTSEIQELSDSLFAEGTGIADIEIRKILNSKPTNANKWELKRQVEEMSHSIKVAKATMNTLLKSKNKAIAGALEIEDNIKKCWSRVVQVARSIDEERNKLLEKVKSMETSRSISEDNTKDITHALELSQEKVSTLHSEIDTLQDKLAGTVRDHTQTSIALEVEKARCQESEKQAERWRTEITSMESCKSEAVKTAELKVANTFEKEKEQLKNEIAKLLSKIEVTDEELSRITGEKASSNHLFEVKEQIDRLRCKIVELESQLSIREAELAKAGEENKKALEQAASKDHTMSDLMKGLSDMQRSSQTREDEANNLRKEAENKVIELGTELSEIKGEVSLLAHEKESLTQSLDSTKKELSLMEEALQTLKNDNENLKNDIASCSSQLTLEKELRLRSCATAMEDRNERIALSAQMVAMTMEHAQNEAKLTEDKNSLDRQWREKMEHQDDMYQAKVKESIDLKEGIAGLEGEIMALKQALNNEKTIAHAKSAEEISRLQGEINIQKERMRVAEENALSVGVASAEHVRALEKQISEYHCERRRMHNLIQELRGNVRVFARIRPFLPGDGVSDDTPPSIRANGENTLTMVSHGGKPVDQTFTFDRVFPASAGQEVVFKEVSEFVQSALDGYNVCLFSYGQTGSGKTHTMQGSGSAQMKGIIPRAIEQVGNYKRQLEADGWKYDMHVTFIEIYNETIKDLLRVGSDNNVKHEVKAGSWNKVPLEPSDLDAVESVLRQAAKHRSVGATEMNSQSSRSHSVFSLILTGVHKENRQELRGVLNLVDLAGSERLDRSKAKGGRAKETVAINKSLSSLTDVFVSIGNKASHIPFRNSKLTHLLQPCLSGDGKALMLANLSPTEESLSESLCTLRFASNVNKCELGKATCSMKGMKDGIRPTNTTTAIKMTPDRPSSSLRSTPTQKASHNLSNTKRNGSRLRQRNV